MPANASTQRPDRRAAAGSGGRCRLRPAGAGHELRLGCGPRENGFRPRPRRGVKIAKRATDGWTRGSIDAPVAERNPNEARHRLFVLAHGVSGGLDAPRSIGERRDRSRAQALQSLARRRSLQPRAVVLGSGRRGLLRVGVAGFRAGAAAVSDTVADPAVPGLRAAASAARGLPVRGRAAGSETGVDRDGELLPCEQGCLRNGLRSGRPAGGLHAAVADGGCGPDRGGRRRL